MRAWESDGRAFTVERGGQTLAAEAIGNGPAIVLLHAITASRRYVVHGSKLIGRRDLTAIAFDARGHGESSPAADGAGYTYAAMVADLDAVIDSAPQGPVVVAGSSMGAHTVAAYALSNPARLAGIVLIGPAYPGIPATDEAIARWDALADGLASDGVEGFLAAYEAQGLDPRWRDTLIRITRERLLVHRHPAAVAEAIRAVTRDVPFDGLEELEFCDLPALVVASHDEADPGHPYSLAEEYARRLPNGRLISEDEGQSPLAWQGGRLSREIVAFCDQPDVVERLR
jgi:pimeloyl-ACP methyl ester carboxylesterase